MLELEIQREGKVWSQRYERGDPVSEFGRRAADPSLAGKPSGEVDSLLDLGLF